MIDNKTCLRPRRDWILAVLPLVVAGAWAFGTYKVASHVKTINLARLIGAAMTGGLTDEQAVPRMQHSQVFPFVPAPSPHRTPEEIEAFKRNREQIAYVEGVVYIWETAMYWMVRFLITVGIVSLLAGWSRGLHLMAAVVILLSTSVTMIGFNFLVDPEKGGLPPLSVWTHILVASIQSSYGVVLLIAFVPKANKTY